MVPKTVQFHSRGSPFWLPFRDLFRRSIFRCILVALWLTLGSILAPFGSLLAPFWLPFGSFLDPFWFSFDSVWLFCSILEFIGLPFISLLSLLICFRNLFVSFGKFLSLFLIQRRSDPINCLPIPACPIPRDPLACKLAFQGPEREYCRRQLRSAPGRGFPPAPRACWDSKTVLGSSLPVFVPFLSGFLLDVLLVGNHLASILGTRGRRKLIPKPTHF